MKCVWNLLSAIETTAMKVIRHAGVDGRMIILNVMGKMLH